MTDSKDVLDREHHLIITSLHDAQAHCECGQWFYARSGPATRAEIKVEHTLHREQFGR